MVANIRLTAQQRTRRNQHGWTLIELMLTCGVLAIVTLIAVTRLSLSYHADQDVDRVTKLLRHVLESAKEKARHDRMPIRVVVSEDPAPCYWLEQMPDAVWESLGEKQPVVPRVSFSGDLTIEFRSDGTAGTAASLWIQEDSCQQEIVVTQATGRITVSGS